MFTAETEAPIIHLLFKSMVLQGKTGSESSDLEDSSAGACDGNNDGKRRSHERSIGQWKPDTERAPKPQFDALDLERKKVKRRVARKSVKLGKMRGECCARQMERGGLVRIVDRVLRKTHKSRRNFSLALWGSHKNIILMHEVEGWARVGKRRESSGRRWTVDANKSKLPRNTDD